MVIKISDERRFEDLRLSYSSSEDISHVHVIKKKKEQRKRREERREPEGLNLNCT